MAFWGLISKRERYGLTLRGAITLACFGIVLLVFVVCNLFSFLAISEPVVGDIMVVEGWLPDYALASALDDFKRGRYQLLVTTGVPLESGSHFSEHGTYAEVAAATIRAMGFDEENLVAVSTPAVKRNRTYESALQLKKWLQVNGHKVTALNVYTLGAHARRTRLLFNYVFAPEVDIGVIAVTSREYEPNRWWNYSSGLHDMLKETIGYIYTKFFFKPY
jgi:hypothetical protein